ncbi:MAG: hypothetical protein ACK53T_12790 [Planctomycetota bacterium]|jgi:hypothetical protein
MDLAEKIRKLKAQYSWREMSEVLHLRHPHLLRAVAKGGNKSATLIEAIYNAAGSDIESEAANKLEQLMNERAVKRKKIRL